MGYRVMQQLYIWSTILFILLAFMPTSWEYMFLFVILAFSSGTLLICGYLKRFYVFQ